MVEPRKLQNDDRFSRRKRWPSPRKALSLLEVVLALSILAISAGILASITRTASDNGLMGHRLATSQILAESKMAEVLVGAIPVQTGTSWTQITDPVPSGVWYYQVTTSPAASQDLIGVRLAITDQQGLDDNAELFYVVRLIIDPSLGLDNPPSTSSGTGTNTNGGTGGSTSGGSTTGGGIQ